MTQIDIMSNILAESGYSFCDEYSRASSDVNILNDVNILKFAKEKFEAKVYFNFKSGNIVNIFIDSNKNYHIRGSLDIEKKVIQDKFLVKLREEKINSILE